jgi:lipopolysaccharide/colanic/teichoic acid biosynthesis glycosyltransferase
MSRPYDRIKRLFDVAISAFAIVLSFPVQAAVAGIIAVKLGRPVLFRQQRPGLHGETFELIKFRSMKPSRSEFESDEERMTPFGAALRATSLDELPTLWNVLRGDMSLVGPRPLLTSYLDRYTERQARRHEVRPGITGLAQVNGRNALGWEERLELDVRYVDSRSLRLDAQILLKTIMTVVRRDGISAEGHVTMSEFRGREDQRES